MNTYKEWLNNMKNKDIRECKQEVLKRQDGKPRQLVFDYPTLEETQQVLGNCNLKGPWAVKDLELINYRFNDLEK